MPESRVPGSDPLPPRSSDASTPPDESGDAADRFARAGEIFLELREKGLEKRELELDRACGGDASLRAMVLDLLVGDRSPLPEEALADDIRAVREATLGDTAAATARGVDRIGPYRLIERIGEGGFGVVFMAEQERPVRRTVALKIIKLGMDTRQVIARFEAERQALAMMDHPGIARVFDAGATSTGRPYFVMELVRGLPITEYCDCHELVVRDRLELIVQVCAALEHAHQRGVIHRDIKPSNVLVGDSESGGPQVKIIDFGVAKATSAKLTDQTLVTELRQMIGTPEYMSPEQAGHSLQAVDTRSDVYATGVLLYELLTGTTPLETDQLRSATMADVQRIIREQDPPKPSTRARSGQTDATKARSKRFVSQADLSRELRGELDWIVMKAPGKGSFPTLSVGWCTCGGHRTIPAG